jgi:hypothetical protein
VARSFNEFIAPDFPDEGIGVLQIPNPLAHQAFDGNHFVLVAG